MQLKFRSPTDFLSPTPRSAHSSCMVSPSLDTVPEVNSDGGDLGYFGRLTVSPLPDSASDADSEGGDSDATLEDTDIFGKIGHPLERIPRLGSYDVVLASDSDQDLGHGIIYHPGVACSSCCTSRSQSLSSVTSLLTDYQAVVDDLLDGSGNPFDDLDPQNFVTLDSNPSTSISSSPFGPPLMIKRVLRDSTELSILLDLNSADLRHDPWNPCPHILQVVDHDPKSPYLYLCMERLTEYNTPPMSTVAQYIDFFRQVLEGLSFLHEHKLVGFSCFDPSSYMVDLSSGPHSNTASTVSLLPAATSHGQVQDTSTPSKSLSGLRDHAQHRHHRHHNSQTSGVQSFDRSIYPVRYYSVNFSHTRRVEDDTSVRDRTASTPPPSFLSKHPLPPKQLCPFKQDVQDLGLMIERVLSDLPNVVGVKFKALIKAMAIGGFGAEDSRKLFEALCRSLEACVFDMPVKSGAGIRSQSIDLPVNGSSGLNGLSCRVSRIKGDFGLEPEKAALSS
ncbi:hypothetical protein P691DRAFT_678459 [Macrolepiota fuliginosa MF-IS2]|uniref:Protein kinase domain-containing protein n=1 Tax=Macrolepiota fuliginosa MF-IS2 TaxID=1400762 RepID=A0A9P5X726_9AGAR|nr:hypothetical protein P691DRAFT_678459 [Macrolepiota fuliginosa MF-IS2]